MPRHKQVTTCRKSGGPVSKLCTCEHCALSVCEVCGGGEGALTTDCPGAQISGERLEELCETTLDFTDDRGWHLGEVTARRSPRFEKRAASNPALDHDCPACRSKRGEDCWIEISITSPKVVTIDDGLTHLARVKLVEPQQPSKVAHAPLLAVAQTRLIGCACGWRTSQGVTDAEDAFVTHVTLARLTPSTNWEAVDRTMDLKHELAQKAIAWVLADRICEDHSAALVRLEEEAGARVPKGQEPNELGRELLGKLEHAKIDFRRADQRAQKCDDEFRQVARKLVEALERDPVRRAQGTP